MFDITSSKLLILGIVALLVIGPKDLPALLRTIGKYVGIIKRQAAEFRAQFDEAMRESELAELRKDVEALGRDAEQSMRAAEQSVEKDWAQAQASVDSALDGAQPAPAQEPAATPSAQAEPPGETAASALNGSASHAEPAALESAKLNPETQRPADAVTQQVETQQVEKSGA
jgi:sec-independent protein translocase protein TatB